MNGRQIVLEIDSEGILAGEMHNGNLRILSAAALPENETAMREELKAFCSSLPPDADEYSCSWSTPRMTLVPAGMIGTVKPSEVLNFTISQSVESSETDYNRLMSWNLAALFHSPGWLKSVLIPKFPRIIVQHELTHILHQLNTGSTVPTKMIAVIHRNYTCFVFRKDGKIVHASYQQTQTAEDIAYHLLYTMKQLEIGSGELVVESNSDKTFEEAGSFEKIAGKVRELQQLKITVNRYEHLKYQRLCV